MGLLREPHVVQGPKSMSVQKPTRRRVLISGLVQGVGFRAAAAREARRLGLSGYAANLVDGRVEVAACGSDHAVAALVDWLEVGPPEARVRGVEIDEILGLEIPPRFIIR